jgi:hypothetical protein
MVPKVWTHYHIGGMEIDILVGAPNMLPRDFLSVSDREQRQYMSASVGNLATQFVNRQALLFKDMVRVAKDWRDSFKHWEKDCKPKS